MKPKEEKTNAHAASASEKVDVKKITEEAFEPNIYKGYYEARSPAPKTEYIPKSERLLAIFDMLTDKSFPRKGPGKSTKVKILDAIIMAAIDKKLIIQEEKDAKSRLLR